MSAIRLLVGRMRTEALPALMLSLLVLATAFLAAATPRLFNGAADEGLRHEIADAPSAERNIQLGQITLTEFIPDADAGMDEVERAGEVLEAELPDSVRRVLADDRSFAESIGWRVAESPLKFVGLRFQGELDGDIRVVDGRMPSGETRQVPEPEGTEAGGGPSDGTLFEIALSSSTAEELDVVVGDQLELYPDPDDPLVGAFGFDATAVIEVVGIFEVIDPTANIWFDDQALHRPTLIPLGIDTVLVYGTALASPDAFPALLGYGLPARYTWRHYVDPELMDGGRALDQLVTDLRRIDSSYASFASVASDSTTLQTGLLGLAEAFRAERRAAEAILTIAAVGPIAIALAAMGTLALLAMRRRRRALILLRGRGGSAAQIVGSHLLEGLLLTAAPAALGALLATRLVEARPNEWSAPAAALVAVATTIVLLAVTLPTALSPLRTLQREDAGAGGGGPRRMVFEALAVVLAAAGVVLLRQRGLAGGSAAGDQGGVDPFLAAVPALVGVAVGIVTVRLYPFPVRAAGWLAANGRGLVAALGLRRAERQSGSGHLPLIVVLVTVAIGAFSGTMLATIERGQSAATWSQVGAAHRVSITSPLPADFDLSDVAGVTDVAGAFETNAGIGSAGGTRIDLVAIDAAAYEAVTAGTPAQTQFPAAFRQPASEDASGSGSGSGEDPIPAIVSRSLIGESSTPLSVGATFEVAVASRFATFEVIEVRRDLPGLAAGSPFVVVPRAQLSASLQDRTLVATSLFARAPADAAPAIRAALEASPVDWRMESQSALHDELRARPLVQAVERGFLVSLLVALAFAAVAIILSLLLAGAARTRETAHLRTLGLNRPQVVILALLEHGPPVLVAVVAGLLLGVAVGWVTLPGLGLGAFTGSEADPVLIVDPAQLAALTAALLVVVIVGVALSAWSQRRADPGRAVREGVQ